MTPIRVRVTSHTHTHPPSDTLLESALLDNLSFSIPPPHFFLFLLFSPPPPSLTLSLLESLRLSVSSLSPRRRGGVHHFRECFSDITETNGPFAIWDSGVAARWAGGRRVTPQLYTGTLHWPKSTQTVSSHTHTHTHTHLTLPVSLAISGTEKSKAACPATISTFTGVLARPSLSPLMSLMTLTPTPLFLPRSPSPPLLLLLLHLSPSSFSHSVRFPFSPSLGSLLWCLTHGGEINQTVIFSRWHNYLVLETTVWWGVLGALDVLENKLPQRVSQGCVILYMWSGRSLGWDIPRSHREMRKNWKLWGLLGRLFLWEHS